MPGCAAAKAAADEPIIAESLSERPPALWTSPAFSSCDRLKANSEVTALKLEHKTPARPTRTRGLQPPRRVVNF